MLGKRSLAHEASVVGDTVGDPFKDTAGPSLHVVIKLLSTITLVLAPLFIALHPIAIDLTTASGWSGSNGAPWLAAHHILRATCKKQSQAWDVLYITVCEPIRPTSRNAWCERWLTVSPCEKPRAALVWR